MQVQEVVMEADADQFKIIDKYYEALPRSSKDELHALDLKLIQRGQQTPIEVRRSDMGILDGYTRHDLLGQRGKKIKYIFKDFATEEEEFEYVVETNVMRRQLNIFQRVEAMYQFFLEETLARREKDRTSQFDVMQVLSNVKTMSTTDIEKNTKYSKRTCLRLLNELKEIWCVGKGENVYIPHEKGNGGTTMHTWKLLPKGVEMLSKRKDRKVGAVGNVLGKIIGCGRTSVLFSATIIEKGDEETKDQCRNGVLSIRSAYNLIVTPAELRGKKHANPSWTPYSKIKCPHCDHISVKKDYTLVAR